MALIGRTGHTGDLRGKGASRGRRSDFTCTYTHYLNREQAASVNCERGIAGGERGAETDREKES